MDDIVLDVKDLRTYFHTHEGVVKAVDRLTYAVRKGEFIGIVGESACGKSVSALSILRLIPNPPGVIEGGQILFHGEDLLQLSEKRMRKVRGNRIAMVFQEPTTSLNPVLTVGRQISESLELHRKLSKDEAITEAIRLLDLVGIPDPERRVRDFPHQFSGGMQQRIMIAMALSCNPEVLIADEPTTSLDVTVQAQVLEVLDRLRSEFGTVVIIITHNLAVVARYVDRVNVMYAGSLVETGRTEDIYESPKHPYTLGLLSSVPRLDTKQGVTSKVIKGSPPNLANLPDGCPFAPRCDYTMDRCREEKPELESVGPEHLRACFYPLSDRRIDTKGVGVRVDMEVAAEKKKLIDVVNLVKYFPVTAGVLSRKVADVKAVDDVSFSIGRGEIFSLVGESGCGKTTTGWCVLQLHRTTSGNILFEGKDLVGMKREELRKMRRNMRLIFQDPFASLNPRMTAGDIVGEPLIVHGMAKDRREYRNQVEELLHMVELEPYHAVRYPHEFSGGQRQRIGIARALATRPDFIVCDEAVSALDVSIQAQVVNLLMRLREDLNLTYLFIAHDLSIVRNISNRVGVMYLGKIVELTTSEELYDNPLHPYTISLLSAVPIPDPKVDRQRKRIVLKGDVPSPMNPPPGCPFHTRCFMAIDKCQREVPELRAFGNNRQVACHRV